MISCFMGVLEVVVDIRMNKHGRLLDRQIEEAKKFRLGHFSFLGRVKPKRTHEHRARRGLRAELSRTLQYKKNGRQGMEGALIPQRLCQTVVHRL